MLIHEACDRARQGDLPLFESIDSDELSRLAAKRDDDGRSLLHSAVASGVPGLVRLVAGRSPPEAVNWQDDEGWAPLHTSSSSGGAHGEEVTLFLLESGAVVDMRTSAGRTPLHYAASKGRLATLRLLLRAGADPNAVDDTGSTPLHRAASVGKLDIIKALLQDSKRCRLDPKDKTGATPLLVAIECCNNDVAVLLAGEGADLEAETKDGRTPANSAPAPVLAAMREATKMDEDQ